MKSDVTWPLEQGESVCVYACKWEGEREMGKGENGVGKQNGGKWKRNQRSNQQQARQCRRKRLQCVRGRDAGAAMVTGHFDLNRSTEWLLLLLLSQYVQQNNYQSTLSITPKWMLLEGVHQLYKSSPITEEMERNMENKRMKMGRGWWTDQRDNWIRCAQRGGKMQRKEERVLLCS